MRRSRSRSMKYKCLPVIFLTMLCISSALFGSTNLVQITEAVQNSVTKYLFNPSNLVIQTMDTVVWTNTTIHNHDTTNNAPPRLWGSGDFAKPGTFKFTFTNVGYYPYYCFLHVVATSPAHPEQTGI